MFHLNFYLVQELNVVCVNTKPETGFFICFVEFNFQSLKLYMGIFLVRRGNTLNMISSQHNFFFLV
jgi:hypothetical protein